MVDLTHEVRPVISSMEMDMVIRLMNENDYTNQTKALMTKTGQNLIG